MLLGILVLIAGAMLFVQGRYDPGGWREQAQLQSNHEPARPQIISPAPHEEDIVVGLEPLAQTEQYSVETLSDKIDGKADLYLSAGFLGLTSRRFALTGDISRWMERYVYDMGSLRNAYAVFSSQRRQNVQPVDLTAHAYLAGNGVFFVHGPFYVEIIAAEASAEVQMGLKALAKAFIASHEVQVGDLAELQLFPAEHRVADSLKLAARDAFGIEGLDGIFTAEYATNQAQALVFASRRASAAEAQALAEKFQAFWIAYEGQQIAAPHDLKNARIALILDSYEISLSQGEYFIGVHEASDLEFGLSLVKDLQSRMTGFMK